MSITNETQGRYTTLQGGAAIGARLRRLSDRIDREADLVYVSLGVDFEQRWYGVVNQLVLKGTMSVGELSAALGISHVAVSQTRSALEARGLITGDVDPKDGRKRTLKLSPVGAQIAERLKSVWDALNQTALELNGEAGDAVAVLDRLENALIREGLVSRVQARLASTSPNNPDLVG